MGSAGAYSALSCLVSERNLRFFQLSLELDNLILYGPLNCSQYGFIRNDSLLSFLNNFDESLNDDDLWQLSEQIKPRSKN